MEEPDEASYEYGIIEQGTRKEKTQFLEKKRRKQFKESLHRRMFLRVKSWDKIPGTNVSEF